MARGEWFKFKTLAGLRGRIEELGLSERIGLADDVSPAAPDRKISSPVDFGGFRLSNRFVAHPMEGWDGDRETGRPTADVLRRWERVGSSGVAMAWGMEALAVGFPYRANPNQMVINAGNAGAIGEGLCVVRRAHAQAFGADSRIVIGAQLTCSGRFSFGAKPPFLVHHHPVMDKRVGADSGTPLLSDMQMEGIVEDYGKAARAAKEAGFDFLDIKTCHGYWLNETLAAKTRPGKYGGSFENRVKMFLMAVEAARREVGNDFPLGTRLSVSDGIPFEEEPGTAKPGLKGRGRPCAYETPYLWGWGVREDNPLEPDLGEPLRFIGLAMERGIKMVNQSAGIPYANPHLSRPTESPPVDAYQPARDPLYEVAMHLWMAAEIKKAYPQVALVGTGYSYLRQFKAHAAEHSLREGRVDAVGLGRAMLSYPDEVKELLLNGEARPARGKIVCTGDSACTSGPRLGLRSGCVYDPYYASTNREIAARLAKMGLTRK